MSKIFKKRDLDLVIETTLKDVGMLTESKEESTEEIIEEDTDVINESVETLVEEVNKENTITEGLLKEKENFQRFVNYTNY
jgi:hypothetical protein